MTKTTKRRRVGRPLVGVGAVLLCPEGSQVLLVQRNSPPAEGLWSFPGGLVERGETLIEACAREVREETGLTAIKLDPQPVKMLERLLGSTTTVPIQYHYLIIDFWGTVCRKTQPIPGSDVRDARWVPTASLCRYRTTDGLAPVIERAYRLMRGQSPATPLLE